MNFWIRYSTATHETTDTSVTIMAPNPKYQIEAARAGAVAITTPIISLRVVSALCWCGDGDTFKMLLISNVCYFVTRSRAILMTVALPSLI